MYLRVREDCDGKGEGPLPFPLRPNDAMRPRSSRPDYIQ
jgi:hypothetical protein